MGNRRAQALCLNALASVLYLLGDWESSRRAFEEACRLSAETGSIFGQVIGAQRLALLETALGELNTAHDRLEHSLALVRESTSPLVQYHSRSRIYATLAGNRLAAGDLAKATEYLAQGFQAQQESGECITCDLLLYPAAVPLYLALGEIEEARRAAENAAAMAARFQSRTWTATAAYLQGLVALAEDRAGHAGAMIGEALATFRALEQPYEQAQCLEALAAVARSDHAAAGAEPGELADQAATIYRELGARPALERIETTPVR